MLKALQVKADTHHDSANEDAESDCQELQSHAHEFKDPLRASSSASDEMATEAPGDGNLVSSPSSASSTATQQTAANQAQDVPALSEHQQRLRQLTPHEFELHAKLLNVQTQALIRRVLGGGDSSSTTQSPGSL